MKILDEIKFDDNDLVPAIAQDCHSGEVLMMAWMNREAIEKTISSGKAHYYSRSRKKLWLKGETSGHYQQVKGFFYDCDLDTLLLKVEQTGVACHTGERSCFYREVETSFTEKSSTSEILERVYRVILQRKSNPRERSYVSSLFAKGIDSILKKVGEESSELIISAKGGEKGEVVRETADLLFHCLVLLGQLDITPNEVYAELEKRFGTSGIEEKERREKK